MRRRWAAPRSGGVPPGYLATQCGSALSDLLLLAGHLVGGLGIG